MEVHTHTHTPRKKWTHYFWEFLMLFLAVTLGFFVENQREHYIEHQRARRNAVSLIADLCADTLEIHNNLRYNKWFFDTVDSAMSELRKPLKLQNDTVIMVKGTHPVLLNQIFDAQMGSYEQIKSSGSLRYFKQEIINKITFYESRVSRINRMSEEYLDFLRQVTDFTIKLSNKEFFDAWTSKLPVTGKKVFIKDPDKETRNLWLNYMGLLKLKKAMLERSALRLEKTAIEIIDLLKKEYHIK